MPPPATQTFRHDTKLLHSRYNPRAEAERFIDALDLNSGIRFFILVEPGLGYIVPPLRQKNPGAHIVALHVVQPSYSGDRPEENSPDASWHPETGISLQHFLEREIPDIEAGAVKIIEWRPGMSFFGEAYLRLFSEAAEFIKRADANFRTAGAFGRRWFRNFFRNLFLISECVRPSAVSLPVVVAGAGPSLEKIIPLLREERKKSTFMIIAVSSSLAALKAGRVDPDIAISTDGGGWALLHLAEYYRGQAQGEYPEKRFLAAAMNAALPSQAGENPTLVLSDGSLWQNHILEGLGIPFVSMPQRGTVSAAALDLALCLSQGEIFLCGLDLAHRDLLTHARPYSFDRIWEEKQCRLNPYYSQSFFRSLGIKAGGSHGIYASWFSRQIENYPRRLHSLGGNNAVFENLRVSSFNIDKTSEKKTCTFQTVRLNKQKNRSADGAELLIRALEDANLAEKISSELSPLLFSHGNLNRAPASIDELKNKILSLTEPYRSLRRG